MRDSIFCDPHSFYLGKYSCLCVIQEEQKKDLPVWCRSCGEGTLSYVHRCDIDSRDELIREVRVRKPYTTGGRDA